MKNKLQWFAAASCAVAVLSLTGLCSLYLKVRAYEREKDVRVLWGTESPESDAGPALEAPERPVVRSAATPVQTSTNAAQKVKLNVVSVNYDGETVLKVRLTERPDMNNIRSYVSVSPINSGFIGISYEAAYTYRKRCYVPTLVITGDFAFRTNVTLRIRKGLAPYGKGNNPAPEGALDKDFVHTFQRKDIDPYVRFAHSGRYLPPCGSRKIGVESVNTVSVQAEVRRVAPANIVQLLAREERKYARYFGGGGDSENTIELSGKLEKFLSKCDNKINREEVSFLPVASNDGGPSNGVYLVVIGDGRKPLCDHKGEWIVDESGHWHFEDDENYNPPAGYRLVCVSDLGVSVRESASGHGVWVTSLATGRPVGGAVVEVYSSANVRVLAGTADAHGWCVPKRVAEGDPFAVVVRSPSGDDMTFLALSAKLGVDETYSTGARPDYLKPNEVMGYAWTGRGIYRHEEKIFYQLILRNGEMKAPKPIPVTLELTNPDDRVYARKTLLSDRLGAIVCTDFAVPAEQPSGTWSIKAKLPGENGKVFAERQVKIEEFAPPQIRVKVFAAENVHPSNFCFTVGAEHLFGGPAVDLPCEGAVVFEDVPFTPTAWKGYRFGNPDLGLRPCFRELDGESLDGEGKASFKAPIGADAGRPKAMVRATGQGRVVEDGGRAATSRATTLLHYYPYYIGSTMSGWVRKSNGGCPKLALACVTPTGERLAVSKRLVVRVERIDSVYSYRRNDEGWNTWDCERIRSLACDDTEIETLANADTLVTLPVAESGDYAVTITDQASGVSFGHTFYLSDWGDDVVRAPLANPTEVTLRCDKRAYRVGEKPRLIVKSPFAGFAMVSVQREVERYTEIIELTNATSIVELRPVSRSDAPNLDVYISVIQSVAANAKHLAVRAHGQTTVKVMPAEFEIPVKVTAKCEIRPDGAGRVEAVAEAPGADAVWLTVVDEGINLLTGEKVPDPLAGFAALRGAKHPLYDLYSMVLPTDGCNLKQNGVKTGGGFGAEMLGRVSPVGTRRFKPLAKWIAARRDTDGLWRGAIDLPQFVGEVRVTAVAYSAVASGAAAVQQKVVPKLVVQPDAPRFASPGDKLEATMPIRNRSGADCEVVASVNEERFAFKLAEGAATNLCVRLAAPERLGDFPIVFKAEGAGESHEETILLPVRPAVAWIETSGVRKTGDAPIAVRNGDKYSERIFDSPLGEYSAALNWLSEYRHGCLEQTCSRLFPLIAAGGVLNGVVTNRADAVARGVARVTSMIREHDFVMWPDCDYPPWDREVSLYAAHFLVAAERSGEKLPVAVSEWVRKFASRMATADRFSKPQTNVAVYAALVQTLAKAPDRDRLCRFYDARTGLSPLSRSRLSLAFAELGDLARARELLKDAYEPQSVKEAAFQLMARTAVNPRDERLLPLVAWLNAKRGRARFSWGTTEENAHALLAIGTYFQANPPMAGEKYVAWRKLSLPELSEVKDEENGIFLTRRFFDAKGAEADLDNLHKGQLLYCELALTSAVKRTFSDLVLEDLLPAAFDPVHSAGAMPSFPPPANFVKLDDWIMRCDLRDDRMLVFSKKFELEANHVATIAYPVRVVSAGDFMLPGPSVEGMYNPQLHVRRAPGRIVVRH